MRVLWSSPAWDEFEHWINTDVELCRTIVSLIRYIRELPPGKKSVAKALKRDLVGFDALEIAGSHRLVYRIKYGPDDTRQLEILACFGHYPKDNRKV
jgi:toxin YoeB